MVPSIFPQLKSFLRWFLSTLFWPHSTRSWITPPREHGSAGFFQKTHVNMGRRDPLLCYPIIPIHCAKECQYGQHDLQKEIFHCQIQNWSPCKNGYPPSSTHDGEGSQPSRWRDGSPSWSRPFFLSALPFREAVLAKSPSPQKVPSCRLPWYPESHDFRRNMLICRGVRRLISGPLCN